MGFFSWKTLDTGESIPNKFAGENGGPRTFQVWLLDDKGNYWKETNYEGYGVFGGKDYYELLAEMNGLTTRDEGINLAFSKRLEGVSFPNLVRYADMWEYTNLQNEDCEGQGYWL